MDDDHAAGTAGVYHGLTGRLVAPEDIGWDTPWYKQSRHPRIKAIKYKIEGECHDRDEIWKVSHDGMHYAASQ